MDYEEKVVYSTISVRGLILHAFIAFTPRLPIDDLSNYVISFHIPEVVDFINNSGIKRGTMTVDKFRDRYRGEDYISIYTLCDILMFQLAMTPIRASMYQYLHKFIGRVKDDLKRFSTMTELNDYLYSHFQKA